MVGAESMYEQIDMQTDKHTEPVIYKSSASVAWTF